MNESKIDLTERLREEGRWPEASKFKDQVIRELRAKGMKRDEAGEAAWAAMAEAYPPLPAAEPVTEQPEPSPPGESAGVEHGDGMEVLPEWIEDRAPVDLARDIRWVYSQLENKRVRPDQAPSAGAWSLLQWARKYQSRFFEQLLPKALAKGPEDEAGVKREKRRVEEIRAIIEKLQEGFEDELRADTPQVIRQKVDAMVGDWGRRFGLTIPADARASLAAHVGHLVKEAVDALASA